MVHKIFKCSVCSSYTLKEEHCDENTISINPAKYSPEDKWMRYRRIAKKNVLENKTTKIN